MPRVAKFDRDLVLERAMQTFWDQGYCATSLSNLTDATDLNPGSIYSAFNSKQGLFMATLDHYGQRSIEEIAYTLSSAKTPMTGLRRLFDQLAATVKGTETERSCFLVNTVLEMARHEPQVRERVNEYFDVIENNICQTLKSAQAEGELSADKDPRSLASFIMTTIWGIRVLLVTESDKKKINGVVKQLFKLLD